MLANLLAPDIATVVWAWVTFAVTFWALSKVAWPLLAQKMEEREIRIREGLEKAALAEKRTAELLQEQEAVLETARQEAQKVLAESRAAAENLKKEAIAAAQGEIAAERERAKKELALAESKALQELRTATIDLTLEAASRLLGREMQDEDHRRLAAEVIQEVGSRT